MTREHTCQDNSQSLLETATLDLVKQKAMNSPAPLRSIFNEQTTAVMPGKVAFVTMESTLQRCRRVTIPNGIPRSVALEASEALDRSPGEENKAPERFTTLRFW